jgi:hypothetical protein
MGRMKNMKPNIIIDLPENHAVDILAREINDLEERRINQEFFVNDLDESNAEGQFTEILNDEKEKLDQIVRKISDCRKAIQSIYKEY